MKASALVAALVIGSTSLGAAQEAISPKAQIEHLNACLAESSERVATLRQALQAPKGDPDRIAMLEDSLVKVTRQKSILEGQLLTLNRKLDSAKAAQAIADGKVVATLKADLATLRSELAAKNERLAKLKPNNDRARGDLQATIVGLKRTVSENQYQEAARLKDLSERETALRRSTDQLDALQASLREASQQKTALETSRVKLANQLDDELQAKAALLKQKLAAERRLRELEKALADHAKKDDSQLRTVQEALAERAKAEKAQQVATEALAALKAGQAAAGENRDALAKQVKDRDGKLTKALDDLKKAQEGYRKTEAEKLDQEASLQQGLAALTNAQRDAVTWKTQFADLEKTLEDERKNSADRTKLQTELAALQAKQAEDAKRLAALQQESDSKSKSLADIQKRENATKKRLDDLELVLEAERKIADEGKAKLGQDLAALQTQRADDAKLIASLQQDRDAKIQALTSTEQANFAAKKRLADLTAALETERKNAADKAKLQQELAALKTQRENDANQLAAIQKERDAQAIALADTQKNGDNTKQRLAELEQNALAKDQALERAQQEMVRWKEQLTAVQDKEKAAHLEHIQILAKKTQLEQELETNKKTSKQMQQQLLRIDPIRYELNSANIEREQARVRDQVRTILSIFPAAKFEINGHTCTLGSADKNLTLSQQRAKRLLDFLVADGLDVNQFSSAGYGEARPVADNSTDAGRRQNRRVEIKVLSADGKVLLDTEEGATFEVEPRN